MAELLLDTDVLIDHLRLGRGLEPQSSPLHYSVVSRAELFAGRATDEAVVRRMLEPLHELLVDRRIAERAGKLRRQAGIALPDALIAASALVHELTLLTRNRRHFERVPNLRLRSPS